MLRSIVQKNIVGFEWDAANSDKIYLKHGISTKEAEEVFLSEGSLVIPDLCHSQNEERFILVGQTLLSIYLFVVFTIRRDKIRIISARKTHKNEIKKYEQIYVKNH
jgi:uncharacterized DUF497 family protein